MKPITYYLDNDFTRDIAKVHGAKLEHLRPDQKFELIGATGIWMAVLLEDSDGEEDPIGWEDLPISERPSAEVCTILDQMNTADDLGPANCAKFISAIAQTLNDD
jgi:hypothetical protein